MVKSRVAKKLEKKKTRIEENKLLAQRKQEYYRILSENVVSAEDKSLLRPTGQIKRKRRSTKKTRTRSTSDEIGEEIADDDEIKKHGDDETNSTRSTTILFTRRVKKRKIGEKPDVNLAEERESDFNMLFSRKQPAFTRIRNVEFSNAEALLQGCIDEISDSIEDEEDVAEEELTSNVQIVEPGDYRLEAGFEHLENESLQRDSETTRHQISVSRSSQYRTVDRPDSIKTERAKLPIIRVEAEIMDKIESNDVLFIIGETGSGKTTQIPQFLYEYGHGTRTESSGEGMIGITQPRRLATISMAKRVSEELSVDFGSEVGYSIRHEGNFSDNTIIHFMTDGVLLRELKSDNLLSKYAIIIIDEAHERSVNVDILIPFLAKIQKVRRSLHADNKTLKSRRRDSKGASFVSKREVVPLKLILMSATMRVSDFGNQFESSKVGTIEVESRQHPVSLHFNRVTPTDYLKETFVKVCKIHERLPMGGILVFVTSKSEVEFISRRLRDRFQESHGKGNSNKISEFEVAKKEYELIAGESGEGEFNDYSEEGVEGNEEEKSMKILPLYAMLSPREQMRIYEDLNPNERLVVVSTNVAETTITIPNITYVVDSGKVKRKRIDRGSGDTIGVTRYEVDWISKASANQRSGRAGRVRPGHVYRLYSSSVFDNVFEEQEEPEILQTPLDGILLYLSSFGIRNFEKFPFPTPPGPALLNATINSLKNIGALDSDGDVYSITPLGKEILEFPLLPRYSKLKQDLLVYGVILAASLSVREIMSASGGGDLRHLQEHNKNTILRDEKSDFLTNIRICGAFIRSSDEKQFCKKFGMNIRSLREMKQIVIQLLRIVTSLSKAEVVERLSKLEPLSKREENQFSFVIAETFSDRIARRCEKNKYEVCDGHFAKLHPASSVLAKQDSIPPDFVCFKEIQLSSGESENLLLKEIAKVEISDLGVINSTLVTFSNPFNPRYDAKSRRILCTVQITSYGEIRGNLPNIVTEFPTSTKKEQNQFFLLLAYYFFNFEIYAELSYLAEHVRVMPPSPSLILGSTSGGGVALPKKILIPFIVALKAENIYSVNDLEDMWNRDPRFLLRESHKSAHWNDKTLKRSLKWAEYLSENDNSCDHMYELSTALLGNPFFSSTLVSSTNNFDALLDSIRDRHDLFFDVLREGLLFNKFWKLAEQTDGEYSPQSLFESLCGKLLLQKTRALDGEQLILVEESMKHSLRTTKGEFDDKFLRIGLFALLSLVNTTISTSESDCSDVLGVLVRVFLGPLLESGKRKYVGMQESRGSLGIDESVVSHIDQHVLLVIFSNIKDYLNQEHFALAEALRKYLRWDIRD